MATEFTLFPQLITELRLEIWRLALPPPFTKPIYPYSKGCWTYEELGLEADPNGEDLYVKFDTSKLEPLRVELPLYSVNREARDVALKYARQQNLSLPATAAECGHEFFRPFQPLTDTMFLPSTKIEKFVVDLIETKTGPDLQDRFISTASGVLKRMAITPAGLEQLNGELLDEVYEFGGSLGTLYVIDGTSADKSVLQRLDDGNPHALLQLEDEPSARLVYRTAEDEWEGRGDEEGVKQLTKLVKGFHNPNALVKNYDLEVQLVSLRAL